MRYCASAGSLDHGKQIRHCLLQHISIERIFMGEACVVNKRALGEVLGAILLASASLLFCKERREYPNHTGSARLAIVTAAPNKDPWCFVKPETEATPDVPHQNRGNFNMKREHLNHVA
jgi:hypothetical protein